MPWREITREQGWLMPPTSDELLGEDHPARFVAAFVDGLTQSEWGELGVDTEDRARGAPACHPWALLSVWLYGFMTGVSSSRKLEGVCRDQVPYLWLTGRQRPDRNTLRRFDQAHRSHLRGLLRQRVRTAVRLDLVD
jgi:transposase